MATDPQLEDFQPGEWDQLVIQGEALPGIAIVNATGRMKVDPKKAAGKNGGTPTFQGREPASVEITLQIHRDDADELLRRIDALWPREPDKKQPNPFDAYHPNLAALGVKSIYLLERSGLTKGPASGSFAITLKAQEFRAPKKSAKPATRTARSSYGNTIAPVGGQSVQPANANQSLPSQDASFTDPR
jgi:hypothetical protein